MKNIIQLWKSSFFTSPVLFIILVIVFIISLFNSGKYRQFRLFPLYTGSFAVLFLYTYILQLIINPQKPTVYLYKLETFLDYMITILEFISFTFFLYITSQAKIFRKSIKVISVVTIAIFIFFSISSIYDTWPGDRIKIHSIYVIESCVLLFFCCLYFVDLFRSNSRANVLSSPDFWVATGLAIYIIGTLPITLITAYFYTSDRLLYKNMYAIIYFFYIQLFLMIIKAYLCLKRNNPIQNHTNYNH